MNKYHKIQTVFKRDPETKFKTLLKGEFSFPELEYLQNNRWVFTEKVDGTNVRIMLNEGKITFAGKAEKSQLQVEFVDYLNSTFLPIEKKFAEIFDYDVCLYGEGYGPKIQKVGKKYRNDQSFVLFDVKIGKFWLKRDDIEQIAKKLGIDVVPIIGSGTIKDLVTMVRNGITSTWGDFLAEGIVARPEIELLGRDGSRIITKLKYKDYRTNKEEEVEMC